MKKMSVNISGHQTSFSIEDEFADALKKLAALENKSVAEIIREIDGTRQPNSNLSSAIRIWVLKKTRQ